MLYHVLGTDGLISGLDLGEPGLGALALEVDNVRLGARVQEGPLGAPVAARVEEAGLGDGGALADLEGGRRLG